MNENGFPKKTDESKPILDMPSTKSLKKLSRIRSMTSWYTRIFLNLDNIQLNRLWRYQRVQYCMLKLWERRRINIFREYTI